MQCPPFFILSMVITSNRSGLRLEYQSIRVVGTAPEKADSVSLRVDHDRFPFDPSGTWWTLKPGRHVMKIEAMVGTTRRFKRTRCLRSRMIATIPSVL